MFESFRDLDLKDTGSCDEPGASAPLVPCKGGTTRESLIEGAKTKHTQREGLYALSIRCRGVGQESQNLKLQNGNSPKNEHFGFSIIYINIKSTKTK